MAEGEGLGSIRFGPFELSLATHELSKHGTRLRLRGQSIEVLELLVVRPGELVTRDDLMHKLWPNESFGDFEHGLNAAVNKLREALCDSASKPIYIETVPGRGYRFIGKVELPTPVPPPPEPRPPSWRRPVTVILVVVVVAAVVYLVWSPPIPTPVWVLITDFDNHSTDPLVDGVVRVALTVALQQSQYVYVFSRSQIQEILVRMGKPPETRIDENTGREICLRSNLPSVLLIGSVVNRGEGFEITVQAVAVGPVDKEDPRLLTEDEKTSRKEELPDRLDALVKRVRKGLGESAKEIKQNSRPLAAVTTPDFQALQLYSQAADAMDHGNVNEALSLLLSALARDPEFAMAHHLIADVYETMGNRADKLQHLKRAYELRARLTPRESYFVEGSYHLANEEPERAVDVFTALVALNQKDAEARVGLASAYYELGRLSDSIQQLKEVLKIDPESAEAYGTLVLRLARNNKPEEALQTYRTGRERGLTTPRAEWGLGMAFWNQGKVDEAQAKFRALQASGKEPYATIGRIYLARTLIYQGKLVRASAHLQTGIIRDRTNHNREAELLERYLLATVALMQGNNSQAQSQLQLTLPPGDASTLDARYLHWAGELYVGMGDIASAKQIYGILENLSARLPSPSNRAYQYDLAGEMDLAQSRTTDAEQHFLASLGPYPALSHEGLARAYEAQQDWENAATEWNSFLDSRGEVFQDDCPADWVLAHLFLARVERHLDKIDESRDEYRKLLGIWGNGDPVGVVHQAVTEAHQATN
jgi:DNA-binding winged helix-turn-helix (wHTH) protein/tetratricopeptide (TPR) repeat protein